MDSDDDFLIEDDEDFDSGSKDELFGVVKQDKPVSGLAPASGAPASPSKPSTGSATAASPAKVAHAGSPSAHGAGEDRSNGAASAAQRQATPALVVAPKPLVTSATPEDARMAANHAANGSSTYAKVSFSIVCPSLPLLRSAHPQTLLSTSLEFEMAGRMSLKVCRKVVMRSGKSWETSSNRQALICPPFPLRTLRLALPHR